MSMSPDDPSFLQSLLGPNGSLNSSMYSPAMGLAMGLLQAGGPSRMPVSFGQALGQGMQSGQQFQQAGIQNAMQQIQLQQARQGQQYYNSLFPTQPTGLPQQPNVQSSQAPAAIGTANASATNGLNSPSTPVPIDSSLAGAPNIPQIASQGVPAQATKQAPAKPQLPALMDPTQDSVYQNYILQARRAEWYKPGSGKPLQDLADARLANLNNQEITLNPDQAGLLIPGGVLPGQSIKYKPYSGDWSVAGESAIGTVPVQTPQGTTVNMPYDKRSGSIRDPSGMLAQKDYTKPLPSAAQEDMAQRIAAGMQAPPTVSSRNPGAADELARADAIVKSQGGSGYDASTWPAKQKAVTYWNTGAGANQLTAFKAAESHIDTLKPLIANLDNTNTPAFNHLKNFFAAQTGSTAPTNFAAAKQYVGGELAKVVTGSGGTVTEGDRMQAQQVLDAAKTPEQLTQALNTVQNLIGGKLLALKGQYLNSGMGNFEKRLDGSPAALRAMQSFEQSEQNTQAPATPANGQYKDAQGQTWSVQVH